MDHTVLDIIRYSSNSHFVYSICKQQLTRPRDKTVPGVPPTTHIHKHTHGEPILQKFLAPGHLCFAVPSPQGSACSATLFICPPIPPTNMAINKMGQTLP